MKTSDFYYELPQELIAQKEKAPGEQGEKREVLEASIVFRKSCRKAD